MLISLHTPHLMLPCPPYAKHHLTPKPFPSLPHQFHLYCRSSQCQGPGDGWPEGSCTRPGCTGWSTGPAGGGELGGSMRPMPGPAEVWPRGSPPPAEPRSLRQSADPSNRGWSRGGEPGETTAGCCRGKFVIQLLFFSKKLYLTRATLEISVFTTKAQLDLENSAARLEQLKVKLGLLINTSTEGPQVQHVLLFILCIYIIGFRQLPLLG